MSLVSVGIPAWNTVRGVRFGMLFGASVVEILVTHEAIDHLEPTTAEVASHLIRFGVHRKRLERIASKMQQKGALAESWDILIDRDDLG